MIDCQTDPARDCHSHIDNTDDPVAFATMDVDPNGSLPPGHVPPCPTGSIGHVH